MNLGTSREDIQENFSLHFPLPHILTSSTSLSLEGVQKKFTKFTGFTWDFFWNRGGGGGREFSQSSQTHKKGGQEGLKH